MLVDEYDTILDALRQPDTAKRNRGYLDNLDSTIKDSDAHIKFSFLTGVRKFSKVSLFSTLNNLTDLTLDPGYSTVCDYTDTDLDEMFAPELPGLARDEIRTWYNGYRWFRDETVYNPYDVLNMFRTRMFRNYWFETGTLTFLTNTLIQRGIDMLVLDDTIVSEAQLLEFGVGKIGTEALVFHTGYLPITGKEYRSRRLRYRLGYPNLEVRQSLNESAVTGNSPSSQRQSDALYDLLFAGDYAGLKQLFGSLFADIPHESSLSGRQGQYGGHYASVLCAYANASGLETQLEESTSRGRTDLTVQADGKVYLFEFKMVDNAPTGQAIAQLRAKGYAENTTISGMPCIRPGWSSAAKHTDWSDSSQHLHSRIRQRHPCEHYSLVMPAAGFLQHPANA